MVIMSGVDISEAMDFAEDDEARFYILEHTATVSPRDAKHSMIETAGTIDSVNDLAHNILFSYIMSQVSKFINSSIWSSHRSSTIPDRERGAQPSWKGQKIGLDHKGRQKI